MAPLTAYNLTKRYFFDYITGNDPTRARQHTAMLRFAFDSEVTHDQAQTKFLQILNARLAASLRVGWSVTGVRYSAPNTDFSVPVPLLPALDAFEGTGPYDGWFISSEAIEERYQGRSQLTGVRVSFSLYGLAYNSVGDFRLSTSESGNINNVIITLNSPIAPLLVAGDNTVPTWYPYANVNYNSYWEGELRS